MLIAFNKDLRLSFSSQKQLVSVGELTRASALPCCIMPRTLQVGSCETSPNQMLLAWTEDTVGGEKYTLHVKVRAIPSGSSTTTLLTCTKGCFHAAPQDVVRAATCRATINVSDRICTSKPM